MNNPLMQFFMNNSSLGMLPQLMQYKNNPQQLLKILGQNYPELNTILQNNGNNLTPQNMEQLCRNLCQQRGMDFNQVIGQAKQFINNNKF